MSTSRLLFPLFIILAALLVFFGLVPQTTSLVPIEFRPALIGGIVVAMILVAEDLVRRPKNRLQTHQKPQPEKIYLLGSIEPVTLYESYWDDSCNDGSIGYFTTPELAFQRYPGNSVRPVRFYRIGDKYIDDLTVRLRDLRVDSDVQFKKEQPA